MSERRPARTLTRRQILTAAGATFGPVALLAWRQPWRALTTTAIPHPTPMLPTATSTPERIALPTARPGPSATPIGTSTPAATGTVVAAATPSRAATPTTSPTAIGAAAGTLLYLGTVGGQRGIVALNGESSPRILVPGSFDTLAVAPDGSQLAVTGAVPDGGGANQLTIYASNGRVLARHPIGRRINGTPTWSPGSTHLLCSVLSAESSLIELRWETWVFSDDGARLIVPPSPTNYINYGWTPDGHLAFITGTDPNRPRMQTLWAIDVTGDNHQRVYEWAFSALGWNQDGTIFYALTYDDPDDHSAALAQIVAIERATGFVRPLIHADVIATRALGMPNTPGTYRFDFVHPSPDGTHFALGIARAYRPGTPTPRNNFRATEVVFLQLANQITGIAHLPPGDQRGPGAWSPDGSRFALVISGVQEGEGLLHVLNAVGAHLGDLQIDRAYSGRLPQLVWSRDSQWLGFSASRGLTITAFDPPRGAFLGPGGIDPAWRPLAQP